MPKTMLAEMKNTNMKTDYRANLRAITDSINANNVHGTCSKAEFKERVALAKSKIHRATYFAEDDYEG